MYVSEVENPTQDNLGPVRGINPNVISQQNKSCTGMMLHRKECHVLPHVAERCKLFELFRMVDPPTLVKLGRNDVRRLLLLQGNHCSSVELCSVDDVWCSFSLVQPGQTIDRRSNLVTVVDAHKNQARLRLRQTAINCRFQGSAALFYRRIRA